MRNFNYSALKGKKWDNEIVSYVAQIHEYKTRQNLFIKQNAEDLGTLVEIAKIQSTQSSNSIEGICSTTSRLNKLLKEKTLPKTRDEEEIVGYRDVLNLIYENYNYIPILPNYILQLHGILFSHSTKSIGGKFKNVQNYISATDKSGHTYTLFTPPAPYETAPAIETICAEYNRAIAECDVDPLILIAIFIHDFLCVHPFLDGNGRMSRLLTTLLLYQNGYMIGKYISLETKIAESKDQYYASLTESGKGWQSGEENHEAFIKYLLGTIVSAYRDFEERATIIDLGATSVEKVKKAITLKIGKFGKADIVALCPTLSVKSVENALKKLVAENLIEKHGNGKATYYLRKNI